MEIDKTSFDHIMEEYILLDLDAVYGQVAIPPDEAFILSVCYNKFYWTISLCCERFPSKIMNEIFIKTPYLKEDTIIINL